MVGSGIGIKGIGRLGIAGALAVVVLAAAPAIVRAEPPTVTITTPSPGTLSKESSLTFSGATNDPLDTVSVDIFQGVGTGGARVREELAVPIASEWSVQAPSLPDGTYTAVAQQGTIEVGVSAEVTFTIDTTPPALTLEQVPAVLATATPSFGGNGGQAPGDGPVKVFIDGKLAGEVSVSGGSWTFTAPPLSDGDHTVRAEQSDEAGNTTKTGTESFRVDTTPPGPLSLNSVPPWIATATPSFGGSGGQAEGDEPVRVLIDGHVAGEATVSGGKWTFTSPHLNDGPHTVAAEQQDTVGHVSTTGTDSFRVDTTPPGPLSLNPVPSVLATSTPTFGGSGGQAEGDQRVKVFIDGKLVREVPVSGGGWSFTTAPLSDGGHTVRAEQSDEAGNTSKTGTASFRIDTTPPAPTVTAPKAGGGPLRSSLVEFKGTAGNSLGDELELRVEIFSGESTAPENLEQSFAVQRSGSNWSSGSGGPRLSNGVYTVRVKQLDSVGNVGFSTPVAFTVASPAPNVTLAELPRFTNDTAPTFGGSAEASAEARPEVTLKIWRGTSASGTVVRKATVAVVSGSWELKLAEPLEDGTYVAQAEQLAAAPKDPPGVSRCCESTTFTVDTKAPEVTLTAPPESTGLETVSGLAGTAPGDRRQVTAELFSGAGAEPSALFETITVNDILAEGKATWNATFANLPSGQYTVLAHQSDEAGNVGTSNPPQTFTVNVPSTVVPSEPAPSLSSNPAPPVASFTWVPAEPTVGQSVSFLSKSTDTSSPIVGYGWDLVGNGPFVAGGPVVTTTFAAAGAHTVRLRVIDANGASNVATQTVQVAQQPLTLMQPFPIVRIAGADTSLGARITLLSVQAPPAAKIAVSCKGHGCRTKSESRVVTSSNKGKTRPGEVTVSFPRFQRSLRAGAVLQIRVSKAGQIGKFTSFTIRRGKLPLRVDACLRPPSTKPSPCPSE